MSILFCESPVSVAKMQSAFHRHAQRNGCHRRAAPPRSASREKSRPRGTKKPSTERLLRKQGVRPYHRHSLFYSIDLVCILETVRGSASTHANVPSLLALDVRKCVPVI